MSITKGFILAAGLGTRLGGLTKKRPKALVEVKGKPIIAYVIERLIASGVKSIVINLHYYPEQIIDYIATAGFDCEFQFSIEKELLDTGGAIKHAKPFLSDAEDFILHNCDILSDYDLSKLYKHHLEKKGLGTFAVTKKESNRFLLFNSALQFVGTENQESGHRYVHGQQTRLTPYDYKCMAVINRRVFDYCEELEDKFYFFEPFFRGLKDNDFTYAYEYMNGAWLDIGTLQDLDRASDLLVKLQA